MQACHVQLSVQKCQRRIILGTHLNQRKPPLHHWPNHTELLRPPLHQSFVLLRIHRYNRSGWLHAQNF